MFWLRQTTLFLLAVQVLGIKIEHFSIPVDFQQTQLLRNRLADCLIRILSDKGLSFKPGIQIYIEVQSEYIRQEFLNTVEIICSGSDDFVLELAFEQETPVNPRVNCWLFFIDSIESLEYLRALVEGQRKKNVVLSSIDEYYLIIIPKDPPNLRTFLNHIFEFCWAQPILNVIVLVEDADEVITIYTYYPFNERRCRDVSPVVHNRFINGEFEVNGSFYISKTSNFWQCSISVILWEEDLFLGEQLGRLHGADYMYLMTLSSMVNSSLTFIESPGGKGEVLANGTFDKAFKMLNDNVGDVMLGMWCMRERQLYFEGIPYSFDSELIVFKTPEAYSSLDILTFPFDGYTWISLVSLLVIKFIAKISMKRIPQIFSFPHWKYSERFLLGLWLLSIFILRVCYEGLIFKFLHNKPRKQLPDSFDEALEQDYKFIVPADGISLYSQMQGISSRMIVGKELEYFEKFNELDEKYALIASEKYIPAYRIQIQDYFTAKQPLMAPIDCIYLPKNSFLTKELTKRFTQIDEHGIQSKIKADFEQKKNIFRSDRSPYRFSLQHFMGAFEMLLILSAVSFVIFLVEVFSTHSRYLKRLIEVFH